jgi:hypothetical protein
VAFTKRWSHLSTEQQLEELRVELDAAMSKIKKLEKTMEEQNSVIANMGLRFAKLS